MRWIVVLIPVVSAACSASIPLGSECPELEGRCTRIGFGDEEDAGEPGEDASRADAGSATDAATRDAASHDAAQTEDAATQDTGATDAGSDAAAPTAWLLNGSFELQNDATAPASLSGFTRPSAIEPWYGCRGGMEAVAEATLADGVTKVRPTEGSTFFVDSLYSATTPVSGLAQDLSTPLRAGQTYAFKVDLWSEPGLAQGPIELQVASGALMMWLGAVKCVLSGVSIIGHSGPVEPGAWRPSCVSFTAPADISSITLMGGAIQPQILNVNFGARLFMDNIRVVPDCK